MCRIAVIGGNRWDMLCSLGGSVFPAEASMGRPQPHQLYTAVQCCRLLQPQSAGALAGASWALQSPLPLLPTRALPHHPSDNASYISFSVIILTRIFNSAILSGICFLISTLKCYLSCLQRL